VSEPVRLWSVTSLLKLGLGTSDALVNWAVNTTCEAAYDRFKVLSQFVEDGDKQGAVDWLKRQRFQKLGVAAARGTDLHKAAEALALGEPTKIDPANQGYLDSYLRFLEEHQPEFLMAEAPLYAPTYGYAGTADGVAIIGGQRVLLDIKTTAHGPDSGRSRPPYGETVLQCAAYRHAELVGVLAERVELAKGRYYQFRDDLQHEAMLETDGAVCVTVSPEDYVVTPLRSDDSVFRVFRHVMECARWQVEGSKAAFGPPIAPTTEVAA
jgi:hypothetical protein